MWKGAFSFIPGFQHVDRKTCREQWRKAFLSCRKHRIDLNVLVEHNPEGFFSDLSKFVEQIDDVDYINLFLTSVGYVAQSQGRWSKG